VAERRKGDQSGAGRGRAPSGVQRCVELAQGYGPMAARDDRPRSGKEPTITADQGWVVDLACRKAIVVVGWTDPGGSRPHLGALLLGYYTDDGKLTAASAPACRTRRWLISPVAWTL
jgi:hypothetical protein